MRTSRSVRIQAQLSGISVRTRRGERRRAVDPEVIRCEVFYDYDYFCPFVYRASVLLQNVGRSSAFRCEVTWRCFSPAEVNSKDDGWAAWGAPVPEQVSGKWAPRDGRRRAIDPRDQGLGGQLTIKLFGSFQAAGSSVFSGVK